GMCYLDGVDVEENYPEAFRWLSIAADKGSPRAISNLGVCYLEGWGTERDQAKAIALFLQAAKKGEFMPKILLARIYADEQNVESAMFWYQEALGDREHVDADEEIAEAVEYLAQFAVKQ
ncbi:MAG TPA: hypothetical protein VFM46_11255, partial [Pseudomonadales bacterium]|nr:hypothetical protein [Pseudomonadales bacterium]